MKLARRARLLRRFFRRGLSVDMSSDSPTLLVAFGGLAQQPGMPPFEFFAAAGEIPVKRLFVRDPRQAWYHCGIVGHGRTLPAVAESLRELIARYEVERLVLAGSSMGGYAALAFGALLGADTVLCFSPQTVLDLAVLAEMNDHHWDKRLGELAAAGRLDPGWIDLRASLPRARQGDTRFEIYFDDTHPADRQHAQRLLGIEGVRLYPFGHGAHHLARDLRDSGALQLILRRALQTGNGPPADAPGSVAQQLGRRG
jgi:pimeloyl-ACP methyl ester carboxylesterase